MPIWSSDSWFSTKHMLVWHLYKIYGGTALGLQTQKIINRVAFPPNPPQLRSNPIHSPTRPSFAAGGRERGRELPASLAEGRGELLTLRGCAILNIIRFRLRGPRKSYRWKRISKVHKLVIDIQTAHAKLGSQDGNSREHVSRSQMIIKWN